MFKNFINYLNIIITVQHLLLSESKEHIKKFANPRATPGTTRMTNTMILEPLSFDTILYFLFICLLPVVALESPITTFLLFSFSFLLL